MGPPLPQKLRATAATLGALSIVSFALRCYVRLRLRKSWGLDDTFISLAFIMHMWYTGTLLTGIHYGTGRRTSDISVPDSVEAMRCWWLCFLAYSCSITLAKISGGFFFLRISGVNMTHRIVTYAATILAAVVGFVFFFLSLFQCSPIDFFWTRLAGDTNGRCISIDVIIGFVYFYGGVASVTDIAWGLLVAALLWNLNVDRRTKLLTAPFLAMSCLASYAALVRMPYLKNFRSADFLYATVDISLWSTIEVGVSLIAANLATVRPFFRYIAAGAQSWASRSNRSKGDVENNGFTFHELNAVHVDASDKKTPHNSSFPKRKQDVEHRAESTTSLTHSTRQNMSDTY